MTKGTKSYSILKLKCPRCHEGDLFVNNRLFAFKKLLVMPDRCAHCNQDYYIEPGFYSAALWISYPIELLLIIPTIFSGLIMDNSHQVFQILFPALVVLLFALQVPIMRISRAILLNITVAYDKTLSQ
jgi:uncharacterized protein (DUF983 family)